MIYLAAAYGVIWLILFIFVFSMSRRQSQIDAELEALEEMTSQFHRQQSA